MAMDMLKLSMSIKKITFTSVGNVTRKENFMYMNPKWLQMMFLITMIVILTSSCTRDLDLNPLTTVVRIINNAQQ